MDSRRVSCQCFWFWRLSSSRTSCYYQALPANRRFTHHLFARDIFFKIISFNWPTTEACSRRGMGRNVSGMFGRKAGFQALASAMRSAERSFCIVQIIWYFFATLAISCFRGRACLWPVDRLWWTTADRFKTPRASWGLSLDLDVPGNSLLFRGFKGLFIWLSVEFMLLNEMQPRRDYVSVLFSF